MHPEGYELYVFGTFFNCKILEINKTSIIVQFDSYHENSFDYDGFLVDSMNYNEVDRDTIDISEIINITYD